MGIQQEIEKVVDENLSKGLRCDFLLLSMQKYFDLKESYFGTLDDAIENELNEFLGMSIYTHPFPFHEIRVSGICEE